MSLVLSDTVEVIQRSIFHAIRSKLVSYGYLVDVKTLVEYPITAVNQILKQFMVTGNSTAYHLVGRKINVLLSTGNNAQYTIVSSVFSTPSTVVTVSEAIPSAVADGKVSMYKYYDDNTGVALYKTDLETIQTTQGYAIELFNYSSPQSKNLKKVPRIVLISNQFLPGAIGAGPVVEYKRVGPVYHKEMLPAQTVNFSFDIHLISNEARQARIMQAILAIAVPKRGYLPFYDDPSKVFFVKQNSYRDLPSPIEGINEHIYMYQAEDIYETQNDLLDDSIAPISTIKVDTKVGDPPPGTSTPFNELLVT